MKNRFQTALVFTTCLFLICTAVLFLIRFSSKEPVTVQYAVKEASPIVSDEPLSSSPSTVNINTADLDQLTTLPEIGAVLAQRIIDYRTGNGPFHSVGELANVQGIGEKRLELIWDLISID